jgi:hypothetical protein
MQVASLQREKEEETSALRRRFASFPYRGTSPIRKRHLP